MFKQFFTLTALATTLILSPAMAQNGNNGNDQGASGFAPGQQAKDSADPDDRGRDYAPGQLAKESADPDDTGQDFAPGQLMLEEDEELENGNGDLPAPVE